MRDLLWLGLNGITAFAFLWLSSNSWLEPELKDEPDVAKGGAFFVFTLIVVELLGPVLLLNLGWLAWNTRKSMRDHDYTPAKLFVLLALAWIAVFGFSASRL
jgi:hypothetical protein